MVTGLMVLFNTVALKMNQNRANLAEANSREFAFAKAKNPSTSGAYMAVSKMSLNNSWKTGFAKLSLGGAVGKVRIEDHFSNSDLSASEKMVVSVASFEGVAETTLVTLDVPPDIGKYAIYASGDVDNINAYDEHGFKDASLIVDNTGTMPPFDWDALEAVAAAQDAVDGSGSHIIAGNGEGGALNDDDEGGEDDDHGKKDDDDHGKKDDDDHCKDDDDGHGGKKDSGGSFYYKNKIPNVTVVNGDLTISGNTTIYGIFVVHGNVIMNGNVHVEGIITMPDPGTVIMHGGGNPSIMNVTGGMFLNADASGTGNHVSVKYQPDYMSIFSNWQKKSGIMLTRWLESPAF